MSIKGRVKRNLSVKPVAQVLRIIRVPKENIAPRGATKGETAMNNKDFNTILMLHSLSSQGSYYNNRIQSHDGWEYIDVDANCALKTFLLHSHIVV